MISSIYRNPEISCHSLMQPALLLERTVKRVFSPIEKSPCKAVAEVIKRFVFSILALLAIIPTALFTALVAFPVRAIAYALSDHKELQKNPPEEQSLSPGQSSSPVRSPSPVRPSSSGQTSIYKMNATVQQIPDDGNCFFTALAEGVKAKGHPLPEGDLRKMAASWMAQKLKEGDPELDIRVKDAIEEEFFAEKQKLDQDQVGLNGMLSFLEGDQFTAAQQRLNALQTEIAKTEAIRLRVARAGSTSEIQDLTTQYLTDIQSNGEDRVYVSRAHQYVFSNMFGIRLIVYQEKPNCYQPVNIETPTDIPALTIHLLHVNGNHFNLLHLNS